MPAVDGADPPRISVDGVVELANGWRAGRLSRDEAIEGFVSLVVEARFPIAITPASVLDAIREDQRLTGRFEVLFARLSRFRTTRH